MFAKKRSEKKHLRLERSLRHEQLEARTMLSAVPVGDLPVEEDVSAVSGFVSVETSGSNNVLLATVPTGYSQTDYNKIIEIFDKDVGNGQKVSDLIKDQISTFDENNPLTWSINSGDRSWGVVWELENGVRYVDRINLNGLAIGGTVDLSGMTNLSHVNLSRCSIDSLVLGNNPDLDDLIVTQNNLTTLDLSGCPELDTLECSFNRLTTLDVSANTDLEELGCAENALTSLILTSGSRKNEDIVYIDCNGNLLESLTLTGCTNLEELHCDANRLTTLDVTQNKNLLTLFCAQNTLSGLNLIQNSKLVTLDCSQNNIASLNVQYNPALVSLFCAENNFSSLNVAQNLKLATLDCWNANLSVVGMYHNQLSSMEISLEGAPTGGVWSNSSDTSLYQTLSFALGKTISWTEGGTTAQSIQFVDVSKGLEASVVGTKIYLAWNALPDASSYYLEYSDDNGASWKRTEYPGTQCVLGASAGKTYLVRVIANATNAAYTNTLTVQILTKPELSVVKDSVTDKTFTMNVKNWSTIKNSGANSFAISVQKIGSQTVNYTSGALQFDTQQTIEVSNGNVLYVTFNSATGELTLSGLSKTTSYVVAAAFLNTSGISDWSSNISVTTTKETYDAPGSVSAQVQSATEIKVTWSPSENATSSTLYTVQYSTDGNKWTTASNKVAYSTDGYTITKLKANTSYYVRVLATADSSTNASQPTQALVAYKTWAQLNTPKLSATGVWDDTAQITVTNYQSDSSNAKGLKNANNVSATLKYGSKEIRFDTVTSYGTQTEDGVTLAFENGVFTITGLSGSTSYTLTTSFYTENASASSSATVSFKTKNTSFNQIDTVETVLVGSTEIQLKWDHVAAKNTASVHPTEYVIQYRVSGSSKWSSYTVKNFTVDSEGKITATLPKLKPSTRYDIQVYAKETKSNSASVPTKLQAEAQTLVQLTTPKLSKVGVYDDTFMINVTNYASGSTLPNATQMVVTLNGTNYTLNLANRSGSTGSDETIKVSFDNGLITIGGEDIQPTTTYKVSVSFMTPKVSASSVVSMDIKTAKTAYNTVSNIEIEESSTQMEVSWDAATPKQGTGNAAKYKVEYRVKGSEKWSSVTVSGTKATITKLSARTDYEVRVSAVGDKNYTASIPSEPVTARTLYLLSTPKFGKPTTSGTSATLPLQALNLSYLNDAKITYQWTGTVGSSRNNGLPTNEYVWDLDSGKTTQTLTANNGETCTATLSLDANNNLIVTLSGTAKLKLVITSIIGTQSGNASAWSGKITSSEMRFSA
ncbi:MAG: fibronectin type III domain-containing protein [Planctomycetia bacterium]|nr:fibronectin type III domain-containing protein [Planctomycetia bacterium]